MPALSAPDGTQLVYDAYEPRQARAAVLVLHGWSDHAGRWREVGERLRDAGLAAYLLDQRGHGRSARLSVALQPAAGRPAGIPAGGPAPHAGPASTVGPLVRRARDAALPRDPAERPDCGRGDFISLARLGVPATRVEAGRGASAARPVGDVPRPLQPRYRAPEPRSGDQHGLR